MPHEYEMIRHERFHGLNIFLVQMFSRTPHLHRDYELGLVAEGSVEVKRGQSVERLSKGDIFLINPMEVHEFFSAEGGVILAVQLSFSAMSRFLSRRVAPLFTGGLALRRQFGEKKNDYRLLQLLCTELGLAYLGDVEAHSARCFSLLAQLLSLLIEELPYRELGQDDYLAGQRKAERILSILNYIDDNCHRKLLLEEIAERENLSMPYLSHFFKDLLGVSFQEYLKRRRFEEASRLLLTTDRSLLDICLNCGFSDPRYLNGAFLEITGLTPAEYRRQGAAAWRGGQAEGPTAQRLLSREDGAELLNRLSCELAETDRAALRDALWDKIFP